MSLFFYAAIDHDISVDTTAFSWHKTGMIKRTPYLAAVHEALERSRVVGLIGPRQCGKTTLAREFVEQDAVNYFDLEDPSSLARLEEPKLALEPLKGLVVIDEIQRQPELFPLLRVLADRKGRPATFLILGSASPQMLKQSSESLAGRIEYIELTGFSHEELQDTKLLEAHWLRGGFPLSLLARSGKDSWRWRDGFIKTFLERDIPQMGIRIPSATLRRFWAMLAHYHGQILNASELGRSMGINQTTVSHYLDILEGVFMVRALRPWHENLKKRQVKRPKIYFRDSGIFHSLMGIQDQASLLKHPKLGASWEGYAMEEVLKAHQPDETYFWATHNGAELDLLMLKDGIRHGVEFKRKDAPKLTPSMKIAMEDLHLDRLSVIYPGNTSYRLAETIQVEPLESALREFSNTLS
jgi:predicted AAA+ superfamily ATPase